MAGTEGVTVSHQPNPDTRYQHITDVLCRLRYYALGKADRGLVLRYLERTTGYSRQQVTLLVKKDTTIRGLEKIERARRFCRALLMTGLRAA